MCLLVCAPPAHAAELKVFASRAISAVLAEISSEFENKSGHKLNVVTGLSSEFVRRADAGEAFDIIAAPPATINRLAKEGKIAADSKVDLVRSAYGIVIRAGAAKPDLSSVEALKSSLLNSKSITYLPAPGVPQMIDRLELKEALAAKTITPNSDTSSELVANGEAEGIGEPRHIRHPGVELAGPLRPEVQLHTTFAGALSAASASPDASRDLLAFLKGRSAVRVIKSQGMEPL